MKIERTKNATRNMIFGTILKVYQVFVPFLMRTAMIYFMGIQYLGLNSLFSSILQVLNLAELGVGSAMVYSMYKPIAEDNTHDICALMRLYKIYYRIIGVVIAVAGLVILPFIPNLISGDIPSELNIYVLFLLNLGSTVLSYWLFAYKNCLLTAHQRLDVTNIIMLITSIIQYAIQLYIICIVKNYYLYIIVSLAMQAITNIVVAIVVTKMYPNYKPTGRLKKSVVRGITQRIRDLFTAKIGGVVVNSVDTIVISAFLGIEILAIYQNYFYILNSIIGFVSIIFTSCTAGIGNSLVIETKEKNFNDLTVFTMLISWIAGFCACCLLCLYQPFMKIWVGEDLQLGFLAVICFCVYYYVYETNQLLNLYKDAAGIWHSDRFRPLVTALSNLTLNLIMVQFWGIYGVLLSTVISMLFIGMPWLLHNLFTTIFSRELLPKYLKQLLKYAGISMVACVATYFVCLNIHLGDWGTFFVRAGVCCIIPNIIFVVAYHRTEEYAKCVNLLDRITKGKLHLSKILVR